MNKPVIYAGIIVLLAIVGIALFALSAPDRTDSGNVVCQRDGSDRADNGVHRRRSGRPMEPFGARAVCKLYTADDGTLYSFQGTYGNTIRAI